jgi:hypothetical protein
MKINRPMLFNGDLLASKRELLEWLGLTINETQTGILSGTIKPALIDSASLSNVDADDITFDLDATTKQSIKEKVEALDAEIEALDADITARLGKLKTYDVKSSTDAIAVAKTTVEATETTPAQDVFTATFNNDWIQLTKAADAGEYAAVYNFVVGGETKQTINIPKDQFLKDASYDATTETINFIFEINKKDSDGKTTSEEHKVSLPVGDLIDTYNAGAGLAVDKANNEFSVKLGAETEAAGTLTVDADGVHFVDNLNYTTVRYGAIPVLSDLTPEQKAAFVKNTLVINESTGEAAVVAAGGASVYKLTVDVASAILKDASGNLTTPDYVPTSDAVVDYVDDFAAKKGFSAIVILEGELGPTVETAPAVNTLFVDINGQTGIVAAGATEVKDISQGYTDSIADGAADDLTTVSAVTEYVGAELSKLDTKIDTRIDGVDTEINTLKSDKVDKVVGVAGNLVAFGADGAIADSGKAIAGEVTGSANVVTDAAVKKYVDDAVAILDGDLAALDLNKFQLVDNFDGPAENDKLYFTAEGQAKIYDGDEWHSLSMEASTDLATDAPENKVVTAKAAKKYVDDQTTEVKAKAVEMLEASYQIGGATTAQVPGRVIAVYDAAGDQCYPSIKYANGSSVISIDDLTAAETFTIIYAKRIAATDGALA